MMRELLASLQTTTRATGMARMTMDMGDGAEPVIPATYAVPPVAPIRNEGWAHYKERVINTLGPVQEWLQQNAGLDCLPMVSSGALQASSLVGQMREAVKHEAIRVVEFDPLVKATLMDDAVADVELPLFRSHHEPNHDGAGVIVAVLDSGIDTKHPWLTVADSHSTCFESVDIPGVHGTHVAGSIASTDAVYPGIAPGVTLLNIKVLDSNGQGLASYVSRGIDAALDRGAHILSMSVGFNHLPVWSRGGHGWRCPDGRCELCTAVDNAVLVENVVVVVAAGNEHSRAEFLRGIGRGTSFDTEIACPGQARGAITVGAITKETFLTADFSSRGPAAYGDSKPDIAAPGVNITSSLVARRDPNGNIVPNLTRGDLSYPESGTSMATPIVAGAAALIRQRLIAQGIVPDAGLIREELLGKAFRHLSSPPEEVGVGRLNLADL